MQSVKIVNGFLYAHNYTMHLERIDNKELFVPFILSPTALQLRLRFSDNFNYETWQPGSTRRQ